MNTTEEIHAVVAPAWWAERGYLLLLKFEHWWKHFRRVRYRIIRDREWPDIRRAQYRQWWNPVWRMCFGWNMSGSVISSVNVINKHRFGWKSDWIK